MAGSSWGRLLPAGSNVAGCWRLAQKGLIPGGPGQGQGLWGAPDDRPPAALGGWPRYVSGADQPGNWSAGGVGLGDHPEPPGNGVVVAVGARSKTCLLYTSPSPRD